MSGKSEARHSLASLHLDIRDMGVLAGADLQVLQQLINRLNFKTYKLFCWPTYASLAIDTRLAEDTVQRCVRRLERDGWLKRRYRGEQSNVFLPDCDKIHATAVAERDARKAARGQMETAKDVLGEDIGAVETEIETGWE